MTKWKIQDTEKLHRARPVDEEKKTYYRYTCTCIHICKYFFFLI